MSGGVLKKVKEWIRLNIKVQKKILEECLPLSDAGIYISGFISGLEVALLIVETQEKLYGESEE